MSDADRYAEGRHDLARALYDALMEARPYVHERMAEAESLLLQGDYDRAQEVLERVDAALADAGEVLA